MLNDPDVTAWFKQLRAECAWASAFGKRAIATVMATGEAFTFAYNPVVRSPASGLVLHKLAEDGSCSVVTDPKIAQRVLSAAAAGGIEVRVHHSHRHGSRGVVIHAAAGRLTRFEPSCMATDAAHAESANHFGRPPAPEVSSEDYYAAP